MSAPEPQLPFPWQQTLEPCDWKQIAALGKKGGQRRRECGGDLEEGALLICCALCADRLQPGGLSPAET